MRLIQYRAQDGQRHVGLVDADGDHARPLKGVATVYKLSQQALAQRISLADLAARLAEPEQVDYAALLREGRVLAPLDHPDVARFLITGTGLSHIGSASARNKMHTLTHGSGAPESDSMKIFRMGLEGGKPASGEIGVVPEWFYKGTGACVVPPGGDLLLPGFALSGAEEPEIVGLYIIDDAGAPCRIGFALGNEFSDHTVEAMNYLYTGLSKLRDCSMGPELLTGQLPAEVRGMSRVIRGGKTLWEDEFLSGESNMSHSIANLEHHHFKYGIFRRPGDLHAHYFGAAVMSYAAGIRTEPGDEFEISAAAFGKPLRNRMVPGDASHPILVRTL